MSPLPTSVETSVGRTFRLTKEIGKGGEGAVFEAAGETDLAFKLYWPDKAATRKEKLSAMASAQWYKTNPFVAFPIDILFSKGVFVGFVMKKVGGHKPVHLLYSPASRKLEFGKTNFRFLVRSAGNIARGVASVHQTGCVIGDVNESGFLVSDKATSVLIDSDSFQVATGQKRFLCQVGKAEYTPPELQSAALDKTLRSENHDNFGLAVLAFQLLFMGKHPYAGRYSGREEMPISRAIEEYRFAYSDQRAVTRMHPPPGAPLLTDFPQYIAQAFEKAFGRQGTNSRPPAAEWVEMLQRLESELIQCTSDSNHHHAKGRPCPWCRMEQSSPGFIAFGTQHKIAFIPTRVDTSQLIAILNSISDPGPWPDFASQVGSHITLVATPATSTLIQSLKRRSLMGIGASAVGAVLICYGGGAIMPGLIVLGIGILANVIAPKELSRLRQEETQANAALKSVRDIWNKESADRTFIDAKGRINDTLRQLADIPNQEKRGIAELDQRKKDLQLNRYLAGFLIKKAKIAKVGNGRRATLASYNIETAADIDARRIEAIAGFGPSLVAELIAWRRGIETRFVFNPNEPTNPADLAALKSKLSAKKAAFEKSARDGINSLQQTAAHVRHQRTKLVESGKRAFDSSKQAELNSKAADGPLRQSSKFISFCCAGLAALGLLNGGVQKSSLPAAPPIVATSTSPPLL